MNRWRQASHPAWPTNKKNPVQGKISIVVVGLRRFAGCTRAIHGPHPPGSRAVQNGCPAIYRSLLRSMRPRHSCFHAHQPELSLAPAELSAEQTKIPVLWSFGARYGTSPARLAGCTAHVHVPRPTDSRAVLIRSRRISEPLASGFSPSLAHKQKKPCPREDIYRSGGTSTIRGMHSGHPWPSPSGQQSCAKWLSCHLQVAPALHAPATFVLPCTSTGAKPRSR